METVSSIMTTDPITFSIPGTVSNAVNVLIKNKITGMPVIDSSGNYSGVITRRDIFSRPEETQASMITRQQRTVFQDTPIDEAARLMILERRRHMVVLDGNKHVCGILTPHDFLRTIEKDYGSVLVKEVMDSIAFPIWEKIPLPVIYKTMKMTGIFTYPVVDSSGNFKGLVTDRDFFDRIEIGLVRSENSQMLSEDDPWSWEGVRNVVSYFIEKNMIKIPDETVESITIHNPVVAHLNEKLQFAARRMRDGNYNQLPVISGRNGLEGILLDIDILSVFSKKHV